MPIPTGRSSSNSDMRLPGLHLTGAAVSFLHGAVVNTYENSKHPPGGEYNDCGIGRAAGLYVALRLLNTYLMVFFAAAGTE